MTSKNQSSSSNPSNSNGRGFNLSHQKVALEFSFNGLIAGYSELTLIPTDSHLRSIHLNLRQATVQHVSVSGHPAEYSYNDLLTTISNGDPKDRDVHKYPELRRKLYVAASDGSNGELSILIPSNLKIQEQQSNPVSTPTSITSSATEFAPLVVRIQYLIRDPKDAISFIKPTQESPYRIPHIYLNPTCTDYSRCWVPCVDSLWERCTWEFEFVVPKSLGYQEEEEEGEGGEAGWEGEGHSDQEDEGDESEVLAICSGDLIEQVAHPHCSNKTIFYYSQAVPTTVQHIAFAIGPFTMQTLSRSQVIRTATTNSNGAAGASSSAEAVSATQAPILGFCLPGREEEMANTISFTPQALTHFSRELGSYPFGSFKVIFVEEPIIDIHNGSGLTLCSADLLHPAKVIDQALETRPLLSHSIAFQWIGINIIQRSWSDTWLINGLSLYITGLFLKKLMGNNEYRFKLKKDMDKLCGWDIGMPPLHQIGSPEAPNSQMLAFINLKAPLVLHILDRRMRKISASLGLGRVIPRIFLQAMTGELNNNALGTRSFIRTCSKVSGIDLSTFQTQWIDGSGCPRFSCSASFNKKKLYIELTVKQSSPAYEFWLNHPQEAIHSNPVEVFEGQMTARIHEPDGTPYEHVLDIKTHLQRYEVPFNTKYKRVRRNTKRFQARQAAAKAAAEGDQDAQDAIGMIDLGFGLRMWEEEAQRTKWKVADWTEDDERNMAASSYEWIRMDSDFDWLATIDADQPDYMWVSQLERDRDVIAQINAIRALSILPTAISSGILTRTVLVEKYFYRVRVEAANALVNCAIPQLDFLGLFHLLMLFRTRFCYETPLQEPDSLEMTRASLDMPCYPKSNNFADFAEHFVQRALIAAIGRVRGMNGRTLPQVKRFLFNLLRYNDNSSNKFVDDFYVAGIVSALAGAFVPLDSSITGTYVPPQEDQDARDDEELLFQSSLEVERYQELDRLVPSYHNLITLASLDFHAALTLSNLKPIDLSLFLGYTRQGNFIPVRVLAFHYLLLFKGLQHKILSRYIFSVLKHDESRKVRREISKGLLEALAVAASMGEFGGSTSNNLILEEAENPSIADKEMDSTLKNLRREIGRSASVREGFLGALLSSDVDWEVRFSLLKLAELLFKPAEEKDLPFQPKVSVRVKMPQLPSIQPLPLRPSPAPITRASNVPPTPTGESSGMRIKLVNKSFSNGNVNGIKREETPSKASVSTPRVAFNAPEKELPIVTPTSSAPAPLPPVRITLKPKKAKPLMPGQASGMSSSDLTACRNCLKKLQTSKHALLFLNPVDPVRDKVPNYFEIIQDPMDLSSMNNKLNAGLYKDRFDFKSDFELLIRNAKTYTPDPKAYVNVSASVLEKLFNSHWNKITKTLQQAAGIQAKKDEIANANDRLAASTSYQAPPPLPMAAPATAFASPAPSRREAIAPQTPAPIPRPSSGPSSSLSTPQAPSASPAPSRPIGLKLKLKPRATPNAASVSSPLAQNSPIPAPPSASNGQPSTSHPLSRASPVPPSRLQSLTSSPVPGAGLYTNSSTPPPSQSQPQQAQVQSPSQAQVQPVLPPQPAAEFYQQPPQQLQQTPIIPPRSASSSVAPRSVSPTKQRSETSKVDRSDPVAASGAMPINYRRAKNVLQNLKKSNESIFFRRPVDPISDGLLTYYDEIKAPMDLGTMETKLNSGRYSYMSEFAADVMLIFANCRQFNPPGTDPCVHAAILEKAFKSEWSRAIEKKLDSTEKKLLTSMMNKLKSNPVSGLFLYPVDPVALGIPTYFDVIPRENARDLGTIEQWLKDGKYGDVDELDRDIRLMLQNCLTFNKLDEVVCGMAKAFQRVYEKEFHEVKSTFEGGNKRKADGKSGGPTKKFKIS